ncbi:hypothetical protein HMPREF1531_02145 [Propionibacterium sp. oral taxon 192 str. F0372]|uniref:glycosyltransferase family 4 protein n=1 Tax=Propionibacterium sp. oral taxon 192 TaxID=671222 RepID=UPI0003534818|nr:glycosyltransferase family 1 protein [Propionibacterium sp. oral taxon 192]EPH02833.1 hypothetical protein HMPREF1531_02145 [Propionibacterium sp. oral taxon 192 str. F0372]
MRIALFTEVFTPKIDGVVTRLLRTLDALAGLGHEALVFAPGKPPCEYAGFEVVAVRGVSFRPWYPEITVALPTPAIGRRLEHFRPDVVHALNPAWLTGYGVLAAHRRRLPLLASLHTQLAAYTADLHLSALTPIADRWVTTLHNMAQVNLCTSPQMVERAHSMGIQRVSLWPKAVDTHAFRPDAYTTRMRTLLTNGHPEAPLAVYVGRLSPEKNLDDLLEAARTLPGVRFAFVGSGPAAEHLASLYAGTNTVFTGYLHGEELAAAYAAADIFCFPSTTETLGLAGLEAMASGTPVVGADAGGIPHLFHDGIEGFLVTPHDRGGFSRRIAELADDPGLRSRMGQAARAEAEKHSWISATCRLVEFYEQAVATMGTSGTR